MPTREIVGFTVQRTDSRGRFTARDFEKRRQNPGLRLTTIEVDGQKAEVLVYVPPYSLPPRNQDYPEGFLEAIGEWLERSLGKSGQG